MINSSNSVNEKFSIILWSSAASLLGFLFVTHAAVQLSFLLDITVPGLITPLALLISFVIADQFALRNGLKERQRLLTILISLLILIASFILSYLFFDLSWDGQWYHQTAVYYMNDGWNPIMNPMHEFTDHFQLWVRHYAKGNWYVAAAFYKTFGDIEWAKAATWITFAASIMTALAVLNELKMRKSYAVIIAVLVAINPVATCSLYSFQVDGILISLFVCYIASLISSINKPNGLALYVGLVSMVLVINTKFTGLVFLCFFAAGVFIYLVIYNRKLLYKFVSIHFVAITVAVVIFGYNPYITNYIHRGNPFYPILGTEEYPGYNNGMEDAIEKWETPDNLTGRSRFIRLAYAIFGEPGAQPYYKGRDAKFMWPFAATFEDMSMYRFMDVRISGLGPYFSGILILSMVLMGLILTKPNLPRGILVISVLTIIVSLLISQHTWWVRYGPQLWWIPIIPIIIVFLKSKSLMMIRFAWVISILFLVNALIIAFVHLSWEIESTNKLKQQLTELKENGNKIEVDFQWFEIPVAKRFDAWGIEYQPTPRDQINDGKQLMSVVDGYPGAVKYRIISKGN